MVKFCSILMLSVVAVGSFSWCFGFICVFVFSCSHFIYFGWAKDERKKRLWINGMLLASCLGREKCISIAFLRCCSQVHDGDSSLFFPASNSTHSWIHLILTVLIFFSLFFLSLCLSLRRNFYCLKSAFALSNPGMDSFISQPLSACYEQEYEI